MHLFVDNLNIDLPRFGALTPSSSEYLLPSHWVQVLALTSATGRIGVVQTAPRLSTKTYPIFDAPFLRSAR